MRTEPHFDRGRTEPINNDGLVLFLNDNGKTNTKWMDRSGKNNHGAVYGAGTPPAATPGSLGYTFDGIDDYVNIGNNASLNITNAITISVWVKSISTGYPNTKGIVGKNQDSVGGVNKGFCIGELNYRWLFWVSGTLLYPVQTYDLNIWYHVVGVYNNTNMSLYMNNILLGTASGVLVGNIDDVTVGRWYRDGDTSRFYNGSIDDARIYNRALSQSEITKLFQSTRVKFGV